MIGSRDRAFGVAVLVALGLLLASRQLGCHGAHAGYAGYRAQVDAFFDGRLALTEASEGLTHDLAWTPSGVQQVWGLGVPLWQTPFEAGARAVGFSPFPDRIAMVAWLALMIFVLLRAFRPREGEPPWLGVGSVLITALLPAFVTLVRGRLGVYEEAAIYAYGAAMILLGGLLLLGRAPTLTRYLLLVFAAGLTGLIRPTVWFYRLSTAALASVIYVQAHGRRARRRTRGISRRPMAVVATVPRAAASSPARRTGPPGITYGLGWCGRNLPRAFANRAGWRRRNSLRCCSTSRKSGDSRARPGRFTRARGTAA